MWSLQVTRRLSKESTTALKNRGTTNKLNKCNEIENNLSTYCLVPRRKVQLKGGRGWILTI